MTAAKAGSGVQASMLGVQRPVVVGDLEVAAGVGDRAFFKDSGPGVAHGQGLMGFGGTWYVLNASGNPVTSHGS